MLSSICMFCSITDGDLLALVVFGAAIGGIVYMVLNIDEIISSLFSHQKENDGRKKSEGRGNEKNTPAFDPQRTEGVGFWGCPRCEAENPLDFNFCGKCGHDVLAGQKYDTPVNPSITLNGGVKVEMVYCPPGKFLMGEGDDQHRVTITRGFWIGKYPVIQTQWRAVMGNSPSRFSGGNRPVEQVSWEDCQQFCQRIGKGVRLPTEAEWEYACRAGQGDEYGQSIDEVAWWGGNSGDTTHPVGEKLPNAWGIHDMLGNVYEWCSDFYGSYSGDFEIDPAGPASGAHRVVRGGGWFLNARYCRSAGRCRILPSFRYNFLGFRLCCSAGPRE